MSRKPGACQLSAGVLPSKHVAIAAVSCSHLHFKDSFKRTPASITTRPTPTPLARSLRTYIHSPPTISFLKYVPLTFPSRHRPQQAQGFSQQVTSFRPHTDL